MTATTKATQEDNIKLCLSELTGQEAPFECRLEKVIKHLFQGSGIGLSQFNELLLLLGYDRVSSNFFQYLIDGNTQHESGAEIHSLQDLRAGVDRFRKLALLSYGNIKFGFKYLSSPTTDLAVELDKVGHANESEFVKRHAPLCNIEQIPGEKTYYLGYLIKREIDRRLDADPDDADAKAQLEERKSIVEIAKRNHEAYLTSDHMDVYVATSMRERHEYQMIHQVVSEVFTQKRLQDLKIRYFDPTQAYCGDRIDKGLAEGLMLKRASCTLYLAQESDTFGKDSELASTLAQGKPVVAYIPSIKPEEETKEVDRLIGMVSQSSSDDDKRLLVLKQLRVFYPEAAWVDKTVQSWVAHPDAMDLSEAKLLLGAKIREHYDKRAETLKESHPLGIQVNLETGVANGVLVARTIEECAELLRRILTWNLEFKICEKIVDGERYLLLKETTTDSIFRVATGEKFLTNAFWNFYLAK